LSASSRSKHEVYFQTALVFNKLQDFFPSFYFTALVVVGGICVWKVSKTELLKAKWSNAVLSETHVCVSCRMAIKP